MSQKPASSRPLPPPTRVSNGIPWWLWLVIGGFGLFVGVTVLQKTIPEDPKLLVQEGFDALSNGNVAVVERNVVKLRQYPEHAADTKLLEGMLYIGKSKPLLAVPLLREAADDPQLRVKALTQLGSALTRSRQRLEAIEVFETVLKEDESADDARLNLAFLYKDMISWDTSLQHLLVLKEHGHSLGAVHQMLAEIYFEMGKFDEAAAEYKAAIEAEPASPANSQKASRFISSKIASGNLEGIEEFASMVDGPGVRAAAEAPVLAQKGDTDEALSSLDHALHELDRRSRRSAATGGQQERHAAQAPEDGPTMTCRGMKSPIHAASLPESSVVVVVTQVSHWSEAPTTSLPFIDPRRP